MLEADYKETFVMGRIHNVIGALTGIPYEGDDFDIHVYDCFYKENNGCYSVNLIMAAYSRKGARETKHLFRH